MNLLVDSNLDSCGAVKKGRNAGITARTGPRGYREVVEEIITALSRIRWLFVIARNSSFTYKGRGVDVKQIGRELGVRYLLEGSVRKSGNRVRITAQLVETETGAHVWADRFDGSLENIFDLQDHVATSVAGVIEPTLLAAEMRRSAARPTTDLTAYDLYLRALAAYFPASKESASKALSLLEQAIAIDRITGGHFPGQRCATEYWRLTAGSKRRMQVVAKPAILPGKRSR